MSKAILVIDMPSSCLDCPCLFTSEDYQECEAIVNTIEIDIESERPTWCPLREVPQKMEQYGARDGIARGYNACIDEILGGGE